MIERIFFPLPSILVPNDLRWPSHCMPPWESKIPNQTPFDRMEYLSRDINEPNFEVWLVYDFIVRAQNPVLSSAHLLIDQTHVKPNIKLNCLQSCSCFAIN